MSTISSRTCKTGCAGAAHARRPGSVTSTCELRGATGVTVAAAKCASTSCRNWFSRAPSQRLALLGAGFSQLSLSSETMPRLRDSHASRSPAAAVASAARNSPSQASIWDSEAAPSSAHGVAARRARSSASGTASGGRQRRFGLPHQRGEARRIVVGDVGQHLAVQLDPGQRQPVHELAVGHPIGPSGGADAHNPQLAELPLLLLASAVGKLQCPLAGFFRRTVEFALGEEKALGEAEQLFALIAPFCTTFYARHRFILSLCPLAGTMEPVVAVELAPSGHCLPGARGESLLNSYRGSSSPPAADRRDQ